MFSCPFKLPTVALALVGGLMLVALEGRGDTSYVAGLRERGLFRLAEIYCISELDRGNLSDRERAEMAIELAQVHNQHGMELPAIERGAVWNKAQRVLDDYREGSGPKSYVLLVDLQQALHLLEQARLERFEQLDRTAGDEMTPIRGKLREATRSLKDLAEQLELLRRELAVGRAPRESPYAVEELDSLRRHVQLALAEALRQQGLTYAARTPDRDDALLQAAESLEFLANDRVANALTWNARVVLLDTLADLGRTDKGLPLWSQWSEADPPPHVAAPLFAAGMRLFLVAGQTDEAARRLSASRWPLGSSPQVDFVRLELAIARVEQPGSDMGEVEQSLARLHDSYPPQWIRRGETLVGSVLASRGDTSTLLGLKHAAEHYFRGGQLDQAVETYDRAAARARESREWGEAFAADRAAAAILLEQKRYDEAATRFRRLALATLDKREAPNDHREALLALAAAAQTAPPDQRGEKLAHYVEACREHLTNWPNGNTSDEVRFWLGSLLADRGQWPAAIEVLQPMSSASPYSARAAVRLGTCYRRQLEGVTDSAARTALVEQARSRLQPTIVINGAWPAAWSAEQRETALDLAMLQLAVGRADYAEPILTQALASPPPADAEWSARAIPILAMALVQRGKPAEGVEWLRRSAGDSRSLESLVEQLVARLAELPEGDPQRQGVGQLLLAAIDVTGEKAAEWKTPADRYRAAALAATGQADQARKLYEQLLTAFPKRGDIREEFAALLGQGATAADRERALELWQQLENGSQRGGERWFRARLARVKLFVALGRRSEAEKLVKLTQLLYPELGGSATRREFEALSQGVATQ